MWGQVDADFTVDLSDRIIPTRVGTSTDVQSALKEYRDHPHACGDKLVFRYAEELPSGSSPRVWGQVCQIYSVIVIQGIIPTRVGTR